MILRAAALMLVIASTLPACGNGDGLAGGDCPPPGVLASSERVVVATSCTDDIIYKEKRYSVGCLEVHDTRVGRVISHDGGETEYSSAREIIGLGTDRAILLFGRRCIYEEEEEMEWVAYVGNLTRKEIKIARSPLGS